MRQDKRPVDIKDVVEAEHGKERRRAPEHDEKRVGGPDPESSSHGKKEGRKRDPHQQQEDIGMDAEKEEEALQPKQISCQPEEKLWLPSLTKY